MAVGDEVAIVGYGGRLPGARTVDALWALLHSNLSSVSWITPDRFPTEAFYHPSIEQKGRSYTFAAGLINDVWGFDAAAFGMSPREAEQVDPQQRHLLEVTHEALAHAGIRPSSLIGSDTGVYVGASSIDYGARFIADPSAADVHMMTGNTLSVISNRLSYNFDLHGPSFTVDTACSSSLVALNLAAEAIRKGTVETAIVGGVNLLLSPFSFVGFSRASMLSPTGRCRPFDAAADGYVRAEGAIVLVLRSVSAARKARNRIHATIVGSGVGQDGRTTGLSLPSAQSQRRLLEQVYGDFGIDPSDLAFVEAHGTGTKVGDPMEGDALGKALAQRRSQPLPIGSVKSNIGHLEPASGLAGVLKSILALNHGILPATLHQKAPSPDIPFDELNLRVVDRNWTLPERRGPSLAGVNSFGFGGTNAHVILRGEDTTVSVAHPRNAFRQSAPLLLSAHTADSLPDVARSYLEHWPSDNRLVNDFVGAAAHLRDPLPHRLLVRGKTSAEIHHHLERFVEGEKSAHLHKGRALGSELPITYVFSGNGSQWAGMGRVAWHSNACFREALKEVDGHFLKRQKDSLIDHLFAEDLGSRLRRAIYAQPLLLALQIATVRSLEDLGVTPQATLGHSVGEIAAAWCAGALSLEQAIDVVFARSRHQEAIRGSGAMAALMLGEREARRFLKSANVPGVDLAAINSWRSVTVSGPVEQIDQLLAKASSLRISARRLELEYPFHSWLVNPVRMPLLRELKDLNSLRVRKRFVSSVTGKWAEEENLGAEHWWRNVREPVQFEAGMNCLLSDGLKVFVEIGPKPILTSYLRDMLREANVRGAIIETLTESQEQDEVDPIENTVARLVLAGGKVDAQRFFGPPPPTTMPLPPYPWRHLPYQVRPTAEAGHAFVTPKHPLLGSRPRADASEWFSTIDPILFPWISDHAVGGIAVFPAAGYVEVMVAAACEIHPDTAIELRDMDIVRPLVFDGATSFETLVRVTRETGIAEFFSRPRSGASDWSLHARSIVGRSPIHEPRPTHHGNGAASVIIPKSKVYEISQGLGFEYGASFQRVRHVSFPEPKRAVAVLEQAPGVSFAGQHIDLTALDAAFHSLFASEEAGVADMPMKRMLPVRFGKVRIFEPGKMASQAVARTLRQSLTSIVVNIELLDEVGKTVLSAEAVRLIEAPVAATADSNSLAYRTTSWRLERAGEPSVVALHTMTRPSARDKAAIAAPLGEALLLLEAGCLRAVWDAFHGTTAVDRLRDQPPPSEADVEWPAYLCSSLLWHLETKGLVRDQDGVPALEENCELPAVSSVVRSLLSRHPTMAAESAGLARIGEIVDRLVAGDPGVYGQLTSAHWRQLDLASGQISALRQAVIAEIQKALSRCSTGRLLRVLLIGAGHASLVRDSLNGFPGLDIIVTDLDPDRLEQAKAALGEDNAHVSCVSWEELEDWPAATFDLAAAIDALSEVAATEEGLVRLQRLLRPSAPLVAGEPAPSVFWDIVRGLRPTWWTRSASSDFPVGALLTEREWVDELAMAGFVLVSGAPVLEEESIGVIVRGLAGSAVTPSDFFHPEHGSFRWEGDESALVRDLQARLRSDSPSNDEVTRVSGPPTTTDVIFSIDRRSYEAAPASYLGDLLARLLELCARLAAAPSDAAPARLWLLVVFDGLAPQETPFEQPLWSAVTAALRVAQNEYPRLEMRCIGLGGQSGSAMLERAMEEFLSPTEEREIFFRGDDRIVFRLERGIAPVARSDWPAADATLRLGSRLGSSRGSLAWTVGARNAAGPGEVEIDVAATGLNFRDVMWNLGLLPEEALEDGYAGPHLGMECAGTISAIGPEVTGLAVGDRVVAFVSGGFARHVVAPAFAVSLLPGRLTFEAAATLPVAFLTAYYSLVHMVGLRRGETVLVHGGAGAVGLAALQVARHVGAKVIATAGSEEKRALLRDLGVELVLNSRTLSFADEILAHTDGKGVDVVLNSLAGEAMVRSMDCLKPFGRFVELGKRDFYANTHLGLRPFRRNLAYFGVDVDQLIVGHRDLTQRLFGELLSLFASGVFTPLPHRVFDGERIGDAFRMMQRAGHIGKIVVTPANRPTDAVQRFGRFPVDAEGIHIVIGGTGGFGLATAAWLAGRGARHIVLASRSGNVADAAVAKIEDMRRAGIDVRISAVDVTDGFALQRFIRSTASRGKIKGIAHAAMVLDDHLMEGMDREAIDKVLQPKVGGALNLMASIADLPLDYLLFYSSATTLMGNPGQFNYVAANGFLEGLAQQARKNGFPALAVAWGGIEDTGYLSRNIAASASLSKRFASSTLPARTALDGLDLAFDANGRLMTGFLSIGRIDWAMAKRELAVMRAPMFAAVAPTQGSRQAGDSAATIEKLRTMTLEKASEVLLELIVDEIARVLRLPAKDVDRHRPLAEIGMDSLMMLELRSTVEESLQVSLPIMSLANGITCADVAGRIASLIVGENSNEVMPSAIASLSTSHVAADVEAMTSGDRQAAVRAVLDRSRTIDGPL